MEPKGKVIPSKAAKLIPKWPQGVKKVSKLFPRGIPKLQNAKPHLSSKFSGMFPQRCKHYASGALCKMSYPRQDAISHHPPPSPLSISGGGRLAHNHKTSIAMKSASQNPPTTCPMDISTLAPSVSLPHFVWKASPKSIPNTAPIA